MDVEIVPDPPPAERAAIVAALQELSAQLPARVAALYDSRWRAAGVHENAGDESASVE